MQTRGRLYKRLKSREKKRLRILWFLLPLIVFLALIYWATRPSLWNGQSALSMVVADGETLKIIVFDPQADQITTVGVPANLEVEVARQLGTWKMGSVWELGRQEGVGGKLISETVTRSLRLPVTAYASGEALGFVEGGPIKAVTAVLSPYETNLSLGDKIALVLYSLGANKTTNRVATDLEKLGYIYPVTLKDGTRGFKYRSEVPIKLASILGDSAISEENLKISIIDAAARRDIATRIGEIIEVMGGKVLSVKSGEKAETDCIVKGKGAFVTAKKISEVLGCRLETLGESNFDVELVLGAKFAERF